MMNPDRDELVKLADHADEAATGHDQSGHVSSVSSVLRECSTALRRLASSDGGVKVREFFGENVDRWGAVEWFDRLAKAIHQQDAAVLANNDVAIETYQNIAASSAMRLVREFEDKVRSALIEVPAVKVRELEWRDHSFKESVLHIAHAAFEDYRITYDDDARWPWVLRPFIAGQSNYQTLDAAKAAAQSDYEARIKSALVEVPAVKGEPEPVAWIDFADSGNVRLWTSEKSRAAAEIASGRKMTPVYTAQPADAGMREALELAHGKFCKIAGTEAWTDSCLDGWRRSPGALRDYAEQAAKEIDASLTAPGATTKSDVEALAATTAERPGTVTSEPEPSASEPFAGKVPCHCHDAVSVRFCLDRNRCYRVEAQSSPSDPSSTRSEVTVEELARAMVHAVYPNSVGGGWFERDPVNLGSDRSSTVALACEYARALLDQFEIRRK